MDTATRTTLSLAFSFGIHPDGAPGACNETLSRHVGKVEDKLRRHAIPGLLGEQWEIADAGCGRDSRPEATFVCEPPSVSADDIRRPASIRCRVENPEFPAEKLLQSKLRELGDVSLSDAAGIASAFQQLLSHRMLFKDFRNVVEFHDLVRVDKGILGVEKRLIRQTDDELNRYQAIRVNRFILESVFDESMLRPSAYLNTGGVVGSTLKWVAKRPGCTIGAILVFSHPSHLYWCGSNVFRGVLGFRDKVTFADALIEHCTRILADLPAIDQLDPDDKAARASLLKNDSPVRWGQLELGDEDYDPNGPGWWDAQSAQVWTRSKPNYEKYNALK